VTRTAFTVKFLVPLTNFRVDLDTASVGLAILLLILFPLKRENRGLYETNDLLSVWSVVARLLTHLTQPVDSCELLLGVHPKQETRHY